MAGEHSLHLVRGQELIDDMLWEGLRMDGWMDGWIDRGTAGCLAGWMDGVCVDEWMDEQNR